MILKKPTLHQVPQGMFLLAIVRQHSDWKVKQTIVATTTMEEAITVWRQVLAAKNEKGSLVLNQDIRSRIRLLIRDIRGFAPVMLLGHRVMI